MAQPIWTLYHGSGPIVAIAIHDGHEVRAEVARAMALSEAARLREEDPFTGRWTTIAPTRVVATRSRFEVDLNRPRKTAVYRTPEDAWGLDVWNGSLPEDIVERSLGGYDAFYDQLRSLFRDLERRHGCFLVFDLHSYNHRREGPDGPAADPANNPQVNIGTGTMKDRSRWARLIDRFIDELASFEFPGGRLDVRENVKFRGGECAAWTHRTFPQSSCVLSIEVKKFFMNEWTGEADEVIVNAVGDALASTLPGALEEVKR